jgi:hypothetical protein
LNCRFNCELQTFRVAGYPGAVEAERRAKLIGNNNAAKSETIRELIPPSFNANKEQNKTRQIAAETFNTNSNYISQAAKLKESNPTVFAQVNAVFFVCIARF